MRSQEGGESSGRAQERQRQRERSPRLQTVTPRAVTPRSDTFFLLYHPPLRLSLAPLHHRGRRANVVKKKERKKINPKHQTTNTGLRGSVRSAAAAAAAAAVIRSVTFRSVCCGPAGLRLAAALGVKKHPESQPFKVATALNRACGLIAKKK